jgi:hypothetical protein
VTEEKRCPNARLIALAPEMLEALAEVARAFDSWRVCPWCQSPEDGDSNDWEHTDTCFVPVVQAVVAKTREI